MPKTTTQVKKIFLVLTLLLSGSSLSYSQLIFQKRYGGAADENLNSLKQAADGGFILGGTTYTYGTLGGENRDYFTMKTDLVGNMTWTRTVGITNTRQIVRNVIQTADGGYLFTGITTPDILNPTRDDGMMQKVTGAGAQSWLSVYTGTFDDEISSTVELPSNAGFANIGLTENYGSAGTADVYLLVTNNTGGHLINRLYGGAGLDDGKDLVYTPSDGGFAITGRTNSSGAGNNDFLVIKTGSILGGLPMSWQKSIGGANIDEAYSIRQTSDGGYIVAGFTTSFGAGNEDMFVVKLDATGTVSWARAIGGAQNDRAWCVRQTTDGGYILAGQTTSYGVGTDAILVKLNSSGNLSWAKAYGGANFEVFNQVELRTVGGFIAVGNSNTGGAGGFDGYLVGTDANGNSGCNELTITPTVTNVAVSSVNTALVAANGFTATSPAMTTSSPTPTMNCGCTAYRPDQEIQGSVQACAGRNGIRYYFTNIPGISTTWITQGGFSGLTQSGDSAFVNIGTTNGRLIIRTNWGTCSDFNLDTIDVTVDNFDAAITTADSILCVGDATTLTTNYVNNQGSVSYSWAPSGGSTQAINVSPATTTTYTVTATDGWGCTSTDVIPVTVYAYPAVDLGNDTLYCDLAFITLNAGNAGATYNWSTSATSQTINVSTTNTYWVDVTANGCTTRDSVSLNFGFTPVITITADDTLCLGENTTITASAVNGALPYDWSWNLGLGTNPVINVGPSADTWYVVSVSEFNGCSNTDSILMHVVPYPVVNLGNDTLQCGSAGPITLDAQNSGAVYQWSTGQTSQTINVNTTNTYWVDVTALTCTTRDSIIVAYSNNPTVGISGDSAICNGESTLLTSSSSGGVLPYSYNWTGGSTNSTATVSPTSTTTYTVLVTDSVGCTGTSSVVVEVTNYPVVDLGNDTILCLTNSFPLDAGNTGFSYQWQDNSNTQTITANSSGYYWVDVTNNNCTTRDSIFLTFDSLQVVDLGPDLWICSGENVILDVTNSNATYQWSTGASTSQVTINSEGTYWVGVTKCYTTVYDSILLQLDTFHIVTTVVDTPYCGYNDGAVTVAPVGGFAAYTYSWTGAASNTDNISSVSQGTYTVQVTDSEGCTASLVIDLGCIVPDIVIPQLLSPNNDGKNDLWVIQNLFNYPNNTVVIMNRWGNEVYRSAPYQNDWDGHPNSSMSLGSDYLPSGTYFYILDLYGTGKDVRTGYIELQR